MSGPGYHHPSGGGYGGKGGLPPPMVAPGLPPHGCSRLPPGWAPPGYGPATDVLSKAPGGHGPSPGGPAGAHPGEPKFTAIAYAFVV